MKAETGKRYRHYKGKEYTVLAIGYYSESDPPIECVVYQAEYDTEDYGSKPIWIRPREMFEEQVEVNGKLVGRFCLV